MNIYVGNLSRDTGDNELRQAFEEFGKVDTVSIIKDKFSGDSRGFGFVEMPDRDEALAAITGLNDHDLDGKTITVNEARPRDNSRSRRGSNSRFGSGPRRGGGSQRGGGHGRSGGHGRGGGHGGRGGHRQNRRGDSGRSW